MTEQTDSLRWTGANVDQAAEAGNATAINVLGDAARALGVGIGCVINLMNPSRVVIGGGVANAGEHYWSILRQTAAQAVLPEMKAAIVRAALGGDSPLWGAVALAQRALADSANG